MRPTPATIAITNKATSLDGKRQGRQATDEHPARQQPPATAPAGNREARREEETSDQPSFQEGNKRRVSDGSRNIFVSIEDPNFVGAVQSGREAFRKGDILRVQLQTRQWLEGTELKAEHAIVKVIQHESAPEQQNLLLPPRNGDDD